jgi:hypothetical protein
MPWKRVPIIDPFTGRPDQHEHPPLIPGQEYPRDVMPPRLSDLRWEWKWVDEDKEPG